nr:AlpA family phage regulatory protein [Vibrio natriegens]
MHYATTDRAVGWLQEEVDQWLKERVAVSRNTGAEHA